MPFLEDLAIGLARTSTYSTHKTPSSKPRPSRSRREYSNPEPGRSEYPPENDGYVHTPRRKDSLSPDKSESGTRHSGQSEPSAFGGIYRISDEEFLEGEGGEAGLQNIVRRTRYRSPQYPSTQAPTHYGGYPYTANYATQTTILSSSIPPPNIRPQFIPGVCPPPVYTNVEVTGVAFPPQKYGQYTPYQNQQGSENDPQSSAYRHQGHEPTYASQYEDYGSQKTPIDPDDTYDPTPPTATSPDRDHTRVKGYTFEKLTSLLPEARRLLSKHGFSNGYRIDEHCDYDDLLQMFYDEESRYKVLSSERKQSQRGVHKEILWALIVFLNYKEEIEHREEIERMQARDVKGIGDGDGKERHRRKKNRSDGHRRHRR